MMVERSLLVPFSDIFRYRPREFALASQKKILLSICGTTSQCSMGDPGDADMLDSNTSPSLHAGTID